MICIHVCTHTPTHPPTHPHTHTHTHETDGKPLRDIRNARDLAELTQGKSGSAATLLVLAEDGGEETVVLIR